MELKEKLNVGDEIEIEIAPTEGQYKANTVDGEPFVEKFSVDSMKDIVANWEKDGRKPILCDIDHSSVDTNNTQAAGWITNLYVDENAKRLKGVLVVSEKGAEVLNGLEYKYISPVLLFTDDNFPYYLDSVSLTNTPRLQELKPVYNSRNFIIANTDKEVNKEQEETIMENEEIKEELKEERVEEVKEEIPQEQPQEQPVEEPTEEPVEEPKTDFVDEVKVIIGLPPEATEEDIKASLGEMIGKLKEIADVEIADEAEELVNQCSIEDDKKEEVINCFRQNPKLVKSVLNAIGLPKRVRLVANADEAHKPELTDMEKLKKEYDSLKGGQEKVDFLMSHRGMKF